MPVVCVLYWSWTLYVCLLCERRAVGFIMDFYMNMRFWRQHYAHGTWPIRIGLFVHTPAQAYTGFTLWGIQEVGCVVLGMMRRWSKLHSIQKTFELFVIDWARLLLVEFCQHDIQIYSELKLLHGRFNVTQPFLHGLQHLHGELPHSSQHTLIVFLSFSISTFPERSACKAAWNLGCNVQSTVVQSCSTTAWKYG